MRDTNRYRPPRDRFDRPLRDLRISVTDRCNLRCTYCMPREVFGSDFRFMSRSELLSFEEITRVATLAARLGVSKIRLTGGEPLLRRGLEQLVAMLRAVDRIDEIALTTNGIALASHAETLAQAGLDRVTVSLDSLDERVFHSMSDTRSALGRVLAGIDAATEAHLTPVKINMVVRRGVNDHCILEMAEHFRGRPEILRFIEYMDVGETNGWALQEVVSAREILAQIDARWALRPLAPTRAGEVASRYAYEDGAGEIGVIHSVSQPFCGGCVRARLSADGSLYTCLFANRGHDLRALLRSGADDEELTRHLEQIWTARADRYSELRTRATDGESMKAGREGFPKVEMSYIGG